MFGSLVVTIVTALLGLLEKNATNLAHPDTLAVLGLAEKLLSWFPHPDLKQAVASRLEQAIKATEGQPVQHELLEIAIRFAAVHAQGDVGAIAKDVVDMEEKPAFDIHDVAGLHDGPAGAQTLSLADVIAGSKFDSPGPSTVPVVSAASSTELPTAIPGNASGSAGESSIAGLAEAGFGTAQVEREPNPEGQQQAE